MRAFFDSLRKNSYSFLHYPMISGIVLVTGVLLTTVDLEHAATCGRVRASAEPLSHRDQRHCDQRQRQSDHSSLGEALVEHQSGEQHRGCREHRRDHRCYGE